MGYVIIIILMIFSTLILKIGLDIKIKDIKKIKEFRFDEESNQITKKLPENIEICKEILKILDNKDVNIEEEKSTTSLYMVMQNKILIGNVKGISTRIQTIAHECVHSIQNKRILKFNFIFSNINILYFIIICILSIFNLTNKETNNILLIGLILMQSIFFIVRSFLEIDAMTKAEFLAKEYINKTKLLNDKEREKITNKYKEINKIGIKLYVFTLALQAIIKIIIYCLLLLF